MSSNLKVKAISEPMMALGGCALGAIILYTIGFSQGAAAAHERAVATQLT